MGGPILTLARRLAPAMLVLCSVLSAPWAFAAEDDILIVANPRAAVTAVDLEALNAIYLLRVTHWSDGQPIVPINREANSSVRAAFSRHVFNQPPEALVQYWNQMHFMGRLPPIVMESDQAVVAFVRRVDGAIGYVAAGTTTGGVKIVGHLP